MSPHRSSSRGFTLLELMITLGIAGLLAALAAPSFRTWIANAKVRTVGESVSSSLRTAQAEAMKRYRQVVLYRTASSTCVANSAVSATGAYWVIQTIPMVTGEAAVVAQCVTVSDIASGVDVSTTVAGTGTEPICFGTNGRPIAVATPGIGVACTFTGTRQFNVRMTPQADRSLRVLATLGGSMRLCDPLKTFSSTNPDGCP